MLGEHVVAWHRERGFHAIQFNAVVETNAAAVALWRSLGFEVVGTVPEAFRHPTHGLVGLHVMHLPFAPVVRRAEPQTAPGFCMSPPSAKIVVAVM